MCGIAGSFGRNEPSPRQAEQALRLMRRRGPDANGIFRQRAGEAALALLHSRLSIIDLDPRSNQPFVRDGLALAFNGEIYNYLEIAEQLRARGRTLTTGSDTEVLLEAYRCWGLDCLDRLEGMWAFALFDSHGGKLILCRDRFGEKPLFLLRRQGTLYFASEPKALAALTGAPLTVNPRHVRRYLVHGFRSLFKTEETFFEGVREIGPGCVAVVDATGGIEEKPYWEPRLNVVETDPGAAAEGVRERLRRSVELRLRADVPLAFCLSGGVDSTALACIAARELGADVHAFSVIDSDERYDESGNIRETVEFLRCGHFAVHTSINGFFERLERLVAYHDAPVPTVSYYMHSFLSEAIAERGFKVAVSGTGADEIFTGYYDHYSFWLADHAGDGDFPNRLAQWRESYGRWVNNPLLQDPLTFHRDPGFRGHLYQNRELFNGFVLEPVSEEFEEERYCGNLLRNRMFNELRHEVVPVILRADDMNSMRVSLENRSPYLDRGLVEYAASLPNDVLIRDGLAKWPLREAIRGIAPEAVRLDSRKRGFNASIDSLVDRKDAETRERLLSPGPIFDIVDRRAVQAFLDEDMTDNSFSKFLFAFVSAKLFLEAQQAGGMADADTVVKVREYSQ
ncbi:MAG: asparagine synthase (glutamine-hydrolyzing) [Hyphomicrobiales bacterium]